MKKTIIGILPSSNLFIDNNPYNDCYKFVNLYSKQIFDAGGIPIGLLLNNGEINYGQLSLCSGFIIQGGNKIEKYVYELILYSIRENKALLGICMGAEAIAIFSKLSEKLDINKSYSEEEITKIYKDLKEKNNGKLLRPLTKPTMHINGVTIRGNNDSRRHMININKESILYDIYKEENIKVLSAHAFDFKEIGNGFSITARAEDDVAEAIEYNKKDYFIIGTHFHPEIDEKNKIFRRLVEEATARNKNRW